MILEFGMRNFFSFREGMTISFRLDANCPNHISNGLPNTPVLCFKGANGSGKTNALKGLAFMCHFVARSFNDDPEKRIPVDSFFENAEPVEFFVTVLINGITYDYEFAISDNKVQTETIYTTKVKKTRVLERHGDKIIYATKQYESLKEINLRSNVSILSMARQHQTKVLSDLYTYFYRSISNVGYTGLKLALLEINTVSRLMTKDPELFSFVKQFISECDVGVSDIEIVELQDKDDEKAKTYTPRFIHAKDGSSFGVRLSMESSGTIALFRNLGAYKQALDSGSLIVMDEFDINLHPLILPKLLGLFLDKKTNPKGAQLVFTTHNTEILDFLGRYRSYLVNKVDNESFLYRLDEIPGHAIRNDRPISPIYLDGKIGGVPKI